MKLLLYISLITTILFSQEINFKETKYIYALDNELHKNGTLNINKDTISLRYTNSDKKIIYTNDNIQIKTKNTTEIYTHEESIEYNIFFQLVLGVYTNNSQILMENFTIKSQNEMTTLLPTEYLASVIETIEYKKEDDKLKYLKINFTNQDRITIEEIE